VFSEAGPWKLAEPKDDLPRAGWWRVFQDPVLDRLEEQAAAANPTLDAALARVAQAGAVARVSRADFLPVLSANLDPSRTRYSGNREVPPGSTNPAYVTNSVDLPLDLAYEIDLFGRNRRSYESALALEKAEEAEYRTALLSLQAEVAQDYVAIRQLMAEQALFARTVEGRRQELDLVLKRQAGGASDQLDVYRAQAELASVEGAALAVNQRLAELRHALAVLSGRLPEEFMLEAAPLASDPPAIPVGLPSELLERRPDVAAAERRLASANAQIGIAKAAFFPSIGLTAFAGVNSTAFNTLFRETSQEWSAAPFLSLPLFRGGANRANYERSKAAYEESVGLYRQQVLAAFRDVEDGLSDLRYLAAQNTAADAAASAARKAADLSLVRYKGGVADYFEVIDSERTALDAEIQATQLRGQRHLASILLVKALGGGW
jgi:multidrug efflux system outer membrane protein